jgi:hypothetical protein
MLPVVEDQQKFGGSAESHSRWVATGTAAAALGVSDRTIRNMIYRKELDANRRARGHY